MSQKQVQRTVDPKEIKTLADWVSRLPKVTNLGFDPETREPTVYDRTKERAKVSTIPWKREVDTITVLTKPSGFSAATVAAATARYAKLQEQRAQMRQAGEEQLRLAEKALLDAWQTYAAAPAAVRSTLRHDILAAEGTVREIEAAMADKSRIIVGLPQGVAAYVPPMLVKRRGLTVEDTK